MAIIIEIHGLANKPDAATLLGYWLESIKEGLDRNCELGAADIDFDMAYWADAFYANPQHRKKEYPFDALYNHQPYEPAGQGPLPERVETRLDRLREHLSDFTGKVVDRFYQADVLDEASEWVVKRVSFTRDLSLYYDNPMIPQAAGDGRSARTILYDKLKEKLKEHGDERLMLIAHSMGSIVAYDVLRDIGVAKRQDDAAWKDFDCAFFATIGSPLGLGKVKDEINKQRDYDPEHARLRTPTVVTEDWTNFADPEDPVAFNSRLRDDYGANAQGVRVVDDLVSNGYRYGEAPHDKANHHKSYGYLRTPEMSRHIARFLGLKPEL